MTQPGRFLSSLAQRTPEPAISWLMKLTLDHPGLISLAAGFTDNESLPVAEAQALLKEILGTTGSGQRAPRSGDGGDDLGRDEVTNLDPLGVGKIPSP